MEFLDRDCLTLLLGYLGGEEILTLGATCRTLWSAATDEALWVALLRKSFYLPCVATKACAIYFHERRRFKGVYCVGAAGVVPICDSMGKHIKIRSAAVVSKYGFLYVVDMNGDLLLFVQRSHHRVPTPYSGRSDSKVYTVTCTGTSTLIVGTDSKVHILDDESLGHWREVPITHSDLLMVDGPTFEVYHLITRNNISTLYNSQGHTITKEDVIGTPLSIWNASGERERTYPTEDGMECYANISLDVITGTVSAKHEVRKVREKKDRIQWNRKTLAVYAEAWTGNLYYLVDCEETLVGTCAGYYGDLLWGNVIPTLPILYQAVT